VRALIYGEIVDWRPFSIEVDMVLTAATSGTNTVDTKLRQELSEFLSQKFMCKKNCSICWNTGVRVVQYATGDKLYYKPCTCLVLKEDINNDKTNNASTKE